jgi:hypothetical protein
MHTDVVGTVNMKTQFSLLSVLALLITGCTSAHEQSIAPYSDVAASETNRFIIDRAPIVATCNDIQQDTTRLQSVAAAFALAHDSENRIVGFQVSVQAESDLATKLGLQDGDILLKINDMHVIKRSRLEQFAKDFIDNKANAFVIELDRRGKRIKQVYVFRK